MAGVKHKRYAREADIPTVGLNPGEFIAALDTRRIFFCWSDTEKEVVGQLGEEGGIVIPQLSLKGFNYRASGGEFSTVDTLKAMWTSMDRKFLDYNPEIWLFRRNNYKKRQKNLNELTGIELVENGTFIDPSGWTITSSEPHNCHIGDGVLHIDGGSGMDDLIIINDAVFDTQQHYMVTFEISNFIQGGFHCHLSEQYKNRLFPQNDGIYTAYIYVPHSTNGKLEFHFDYSVSKFDISNVSVKQLDGYFQEMITKKWKHEPHLNGIKFLGQNYYSGNSTIKSEIPELVITGRHTEFPFTSNSGEWQMIDLNAYEFLRNGDENGLIITDDFDFTVDPNNRLSFTGTKKWIEMRFAIVIDNPDPLANNPKMIGPLSDVVLLKLETMFLNYNVRRYKIRFSNYDFWGRKRLN